MCVESFPPHFLLGPLDTFPLSQNLLYGVNLTHENGPLLFYIRSILAFGSLLSLLRNSSAQGTSENSADGVGSGDDGTRGIRFCYLMSVIWVSRALEGSTVLPTERRKVFISR